MFSQISFSIRGHIEGIEDGDNLWLIAMNGRSGMSIANDTIKDGKFRFDVTTDECDGTVSIHCDNRNYIYSNLQLYVADNTSVNITGHGTNMLEWEVESNNPLQSTYQTIQQARAGFLLESGEINKNARQIMRDYYSSATDEARRQQIKVKKDSVERLLDRVSIEMSKAEIETLRHLHINEAWLRELTSLTHRSFYNADFPYRKEVIELYKQLPPEMLNTYYGQLATAQLYPPKLHNIGDTIPNANLIDLDGHTCSLSDFKGKFVFLMLWSAGCGACHIHMSETNALVDEYKNSVAIVCINSDTDPSWHKGCEMIKIEATNLRDVDGWGGLYAAFGANGIPFYAILSPDGIILDKWLLQFGSSHNQRLDNAISSYKARGETPIPANHQ